MYLKSIRKIFFLQKYYASMDDLFEMAEKSGYLAASHNSIIYIKSQTDQKWHQSCFTINDFNTKDS